MALCVDRHLHYGPVRLQLQAEVPARLPATGSAPRGRRLLRREEGSRSSASRGVTDSDNGGTGKRGGRTVKTGEEAIPRY